MLESESLERMEIEVGRPEVEVGNVREIVFDVKIDDDGSDDVDVLIPER